MVSPIKPESIHVANHFANGQTEVGALVKGPQKDQSAQVAGNKLNLLTDIDSSKTYRLTVGRASVLLKANNDLRLPNGSQGFTHQINLKGLDTSKLTDGNNVAQLLEGRLSGFEVVKGSVKIAGNGSAPTPTSESSTSSSNADQQKSITNNTPAASAKPDHLSRKNDISITTAPIPRLAGVRGQKTESNNVHSISRLRSAVKKAKADFKKEMHVLKALKDIHSENDRRLTDAWRSNSDDQINKVGKQAEESYKAVTAQIEITNESALDYELAKKALNDAAHQ